MLFRSHIAMSNGLPVVVTAVGGLTEAAADYEGAITVEPGDTAALTEALRKARTRVGESHVAPHSWRDNVEAILSFAPERVLAGMDVAIPAVIPTARNPEPES